MTKACIGIKLSLRLNDKIYFNKILSTSMHIGPNFNFKPRDASWFFLKSLPSILFKQLKFSILNFHTSQIYLTNLDFLTPLGIMKKWFSSYYFGIISKTRNKKNWERKKRIKKFILACNEVVFWQPSDFPNVYNWNNKQSSYVEKKEFVFLVFLTSLPPFLSTNLAVMIMKIFSFFVP